MKKITVLVVDDSRIFRSIIEEIINREQDMEVVGSVRNGAKALAFIEECGMPDIITLDIEMPEMSGLETLLELQKLKSEGKTDGNPGIIMVSNFTRKGADSTIEALNNGAFDFILKPQTDSTQKSMKILQLHLLLKIRQYYYNNLHRTPQQIETVTAVKQVQPKIERRQTVIEAIVIGVSTGGPQALAELLPALTAKTKIPIIVVQHMPPEYTASLAESLNKKCSATVVEAAHNLSLSEGHVYIAKGGKHLEVTKTVAGDNYLRLSDADPVGGFKPSVNILFKSAAIVFRNRVIGCILTGMGNDGTEGLIKLKEGGAFAVVQDEKTSVVWGMPGSAVKAGAVDKIVPIWQMTDIVITEIKNRTR